MNVEVVEIASVRSQLRANFFARLLNTSAVSAEQTLPPAIERTIENFIDEASRISRLLRTSVLDPDLADRLTDEDIVWDAETKAALQTYFFGGGNARTYKDLAKRKWNFMAGRYTRYWYYDGPGGLRLTATKQLCGFTDEAPIYLPLRPENKEIRVLQIARGLEGEWIGDLVVVPLLGNPRYIAISYTWGTPDPEIVGRLRLQTGGGSIPLTKAVASILENVLDGVTRAWVWIDAICINQNDTAEKNSQVAMMGDIYRQAQQVVVSLEDPNEDSEEAMNLLHTATAAIWEAEKQRQWPDLTDIIRSSRISRGQWITLMHFFQRRWFSRIWIVQEVLLGPRPVVVCGKAAVPFDALAEACTRIMKHSQAFSALLYDDHHSLATSLIDSLFSPTTTSFVSHPAHVLPSLILSEWPRGISNMRHLWHQSERLRQCGGLQTLSTLLQVFGLQWDSTNPRDKIFGLLSMAEGGTHEDLAPRYDDPVDTIYTRAITHLLKTGSDLEVLSKAGIGCPRALDDLPSWVPDWTAPPGFRSFSDLAHRSRHHASRGHASSPQFDPSDALRVTIDGILIDKITKVTSVREEFSANDVQGYSQRLLQWVDEVEKMVMSWPAPTSSQDEQARTRVRAERHIMLWKTLAHADPKPPYDDGPRTATERGFTAWLRYLRVQAGSLMGFGANSLSAEETKEGKFFEVACTYATTHRRAFLTENGNLGLGYQNTRIGDEVVILMGGVMPFVVRKAGPEPREHQLVGEAYLHGFEDGGDVDQSRVEPIVLV